MRRNHKIEWELWLSVRLLAHWSDNIKKRLENAYEYHFKYILPGDLPTEDMKMRLIKTQGKLTKNHTKPVHEAIYYLPLKSCRAMADDICQIYYDFSQFEWDRHLEESPPETLRSELNALQKSTVKEISDIKELHQKETEALRKPHPDFTKRNFEVFANQADEFRTK
ncbi:MAG TPA: hypothetical protein VI298_14625 [Geobacteraceae bacterium]